MSEDVWALKDDLENLNTRKRTSRRDSNRHFDETFRKSLTEPNLSSKSLRKLLGFRQYARESIP